MSRKWQKHLKITWHHAIKVPFVPAFNAIIMTYFPETTSLKVSVRSRAQCDAAIHHVFWSAHGFERSRATVCGRWSQTMTTQPVDRAIAAAVEAHVALSRAGSSAHAGVLVELCDGVSPLFAADPSPLKLLAYPNYLLSTTDGIDLLHPVHRLDVDELDQFEHVVDEMVGAALIVTDRQRTALVLGQLYFSPSTLKLVPYLEAC
ncbi:hypothetical protein BC830DRAFT_1175948 [Chytriomyces sp. MP71]|nr:hypothetical protein BC830DRAFT_1175948 [Chytriomyces sp. MP71]